MKREYMVVDRNSRAYAIFMTNAEALRYIMSNGLRSYCYVYVI